MATRAIIIAGGLSKRLRPLTEHIPKTLLQLDQKIILEHIMDAVHANGLTHFDILTGHGHDAVSTFTQEYATRNPGVTVDLWYIENYATTGNIIALKAAEHLFDREAIIINSDTIFHPELVGKLLQSAEEHAMIIDDHKELGEEEMKVLVDDGMYITRIHKSLNPAQSYGEYVGVMKLGTSAKEHMIAVVEAMLEEDDSVYYEDALQRTIDTHGLKIASISTDGLPVMEIDTHEDLADAKQLIVRM